MFKATLTPQAICESGRWRDATGKLEVVAEGTWLSFRWPKQSVTFPRVDFLAIRHGSNSNLLLLTAARSHVMRMDVGDRGLNNTPGVATFRGSGHSSTLCQFLSRVVGSRVLTWLCVSGSTERVYLSTACIGAIHSVSDSETQVFWKDDLPKSIQKHPFVLVLTAAEQTQFVEDFVAAKDE